MEYVFFGGKSEEDLTVTWGNWQAIVPTVELASSSVQRVTELKDFKKILRTHNNVLVIFAKNEKAASSEMKLYEGVAKEMLGQATLVLVDCTEGKKLCKKMKASPAKLALKHYKDGEFNTDYERKYTVESMSNFLRDPTGDIPWNEDSTATDVVHIETMKAYSSLMKKEKRPMLVMFYAPWCGHCKRLKPDYAAAATELKGQAVLVGINADKPEFNPLKVDFNVSGYPTLHYIEKGKPKMKYGGKNDQNGIVSWMKDPQEPKEPEKEAEWSDEESDVHHLLDDTFDEFLTANPSVLVMFYAPWCGHCKNMKPEYVQAAAAMKEDGVEGALAAVDATKAQELAGKYGVKGFPTVIYFKDGEEAFKVNERTADKIVEFMKDPKEPPPPPPPEPEWSEVESEVNHLTDENFRSFTKKKKHTLVMFYAPWCGHCKATKPEFTSAADSFKDESKVAFAAVDCTKTKDLCTKYDVSGYPTFRYFSYGKDDFKYTGGRKEPDFIAFMKDPQNPPKVSPPPAANPLDMWADAPGHENVHHLTTANFAQFLSENPSTLVMFYAPWCGHCKSMKPAYAEAAQLLKENNKPGALAAVDATAHPDLASRYEVKGYPTLKYFKDGAFVMDYSKQRNTKEFVTFMENPGPELEWSDEQNEVEHLTSNTMQSFLTSSADVLVMFYAPWCGHCKAAKPAFTEAAELLIDESDKHIAAVNCIANKAACEEAKISGYPSFKYYNRGIYVADYNGGRTAEDFANYLKSPPQLDKKEKEEL
ncbi:hypothetical protein CAPTEDRAFT_224024 [Capitella teleta]|uniref:Thioredoxin domain-containing protein n=1 Tax=Capitella teleta TaxID=283909 RepID=R7UHJ2_CAPTE|nr:hypothetical protein CAPTEDRAFT_224024 [Capitella teleta]|eukprot:ELU02742.1 hypothetical protein CAPTEDRAFT_224024 [Capitella teleta]